MIANFSAYVASVAYRTCYTYLRRLHPERARLKNRVRYAVTCDPAVSLDPDDAGIWRCRLTAWNGEPPVRNMTRVEQFQRDPAAFGRENLPGTLDRTQGISEAVKLLLERVGEPIDLDLVVDAVGGVVGSDARQREWSASHDSQTGIEAADTSPSIADALAHRQYLARLWDEIGALPLNQRAAVLLNLRDDDGLSGLPLLPMTGIATIRQIADVLEMPAVDLAAIWRELPLDDSRIARGCT